MLSDLAIMRSIIDLTLTLVVGGVTVAALITAFSLLVPDRHDPA